ncbi:MAG: serine hydrolase domain-containing protein [Gammaproteobacteria bacterium]
MLWNRSPAMAAAVLAILFTTRALAASLQPAASPESAGMSSERLARLDRAMQEEVDQKRKAGIITLVARHGQIVQLKAYGYADVQSGRKMQTDSLVRLFSMTKPITSVALLTLYEQGKFQLNDPLEKYIPAFANVKVFAGLDAKGAMILEAPKRKITIQDVFRHTAGFVYAFGPTTPVDKSYLDAGISFAKLNSLDELVQKVAAQPLLYRPGEQWVYSVAHDVQAYLVEKLSGMRFEEYCRKVIFEPLGMKDTVFGVPAQVRARYTSMYGTDKDGHLYRIEAPGGVSTSMFGSYDRYVDKPFGGLSLSATITDYLKFAQMLLNGGELDGTRILGRKTVELMTMNHLPPNIPSISFEKGKGYGLGVSVLESAAANGNEGSKGMFGWAGAASTWVNMDPKEELVMLVFTQYMPADFEFGNRVQNLVYQAITGP